MPSNSTRLDDLDQWLEPFLSLMGRKTRRTWVPLYLRGLLGSGERKSLLPMAERLGLSGHDQLQHFIAQPGLGRCSTVECAGIGGKPPVGRPGCVSGDR